MSEYIRLDEACVLNMGQSPASSSYNKNGIGIPFFQGNADFGKIYPKVRMWCNDPTKIVEANTLLISVRAPIGALNFSNTKSCIGRGLAGLTPTEDFDLKYIYYYLKGKNAELNAKGTGSTFKAISKNALGETMIKKISKSKQVKIIETLDKVFSIICDRKYQLEQLDRLMRSRFVEMFGDPSINPMGWDRVNISEVVGGKVSNGFFAKRDDYVETGNVSVMGVAYIVNRMYSQWQGLPRTNGMDKDIEKFEVKYGDMLFCRSSLVAEGIGKASIVPEDVPKNTLFECHVIRLPLDLNKCVPEYMQVLSTMDFFRRQVIAQSKTATMTTIGQDGILKTDILLPSIDKQREFYDFVREIEKSKFSIFSIQTFAHSGDNFSK